MTDGDVSVNLDLNIVPSDRVDVLQFPLGAPDATRIALTASADDTGILLRVHAGGNVDGTDQGLEQIAALLTAAAHGLRDPELRAAAAEQMASRATFGEG